jgi:hypothetical protein
MHSGANGRRTWIRQLGRAVIVAAFVLVVTLGAGLGGLNLAGKGVVVGGLEPCDALGNSSLRYASGTVTVFHGQVTWRYAAPGVTAAVFPTKVADQRDVGANGVYAFLLDRGQYVMEGKYAGAGASTARPWVNITVNAGSVAHADVPDMCF